VFVPSDIKEMKRSVPDAAITVVGDGSFVLEKVSVVICSVLSSPSDEVYLT